MAFNTVGGKNYTLSSSISSTATSITLSSFTLPITDQAITMATASTDIMYGTLQPGSTNSELISFTGVTQNANGTATLTGVTRGLDREYPYTESSDFKLPHPGQSIFILSDAPQVFNSYTAKVNAETVEGKWTFPNDTNTPLIGASYVAPTIDNQIATKKYADDLAIAGSPKATDSVYGITKLSVAAVSGTDPIAVGDNDTRVPTQDENNALVGTSGTPSTSNKFVTNDDTSSTPSASKVVRYSASSTLVATSATTVNYQVFTSSGTWTKPSNLSGNELVTVQLWGAGGGGGGSAVTQSGGGGGGGGGSYVEAKFRASDLGSTVTVTLNAGGAGGVGGNNGVVGGNSTFGSLLTAYGGGGGGALAGGTGGGGGGGGGVSSIGTTGSTGAGGAGGDPLGGAATGVASTFGGGGGSIISGGGIGVYGGGGGGGGNAAGTGGASLYGGGGGGAGAAGSSSTGGTGSVYGGTGGAGGNNANGSAGVAPGGGGGGAGNSNGAAKNGGAGAIGQCRVFVNYFAN